jgi:hypothetical protein
MLPMMEDICFFEFFESFDTLCVFEKGTATICGAQGEPGRLGVFEYGDSSSPLCGTVRIVMRCLPHS